MSFDGKNFTKAEPEVFSLESLIAWLEKQPAETEYDYNASQFSCGGGCLMHQYLRHCGYTAIEVGAHRMPYQMLADCVPGRNVEIEVAMGLPRTFGAALSRAKSLRVKAEG